MPNPIVAVAGIGAGASLIGANKSSKATKSAAKAQTQAADTGIAEQRRQFDAVQELLAPFISGGTDAFNKLSNLAGVNGSGAQSSVLDQIAADPRLELATAQAEEALLANAAATGGLRGGNTEAALAELRPELFSRAIDQTFAQLGGLASAGQASATGQATAAQTLGNNTTALLGQIGSAQAGGVLGQAAAFNQGLGGISNAAGTLFGNIQMPAGATAFGQWGF